MKHLASALATLVLAGCACSLDAPSPVQIAYACDDGMKFSADYDAKAAQVTIQRAGRAPLVMVQTVSGSGVRYRNGDEIFHVKGPKGFWITGGTGMVGCREAMGNP
jgi:membrane-bound inhibitor of C-type lysozyme